MTMLLRAYYFAPTAVLGYAKRRLFQQGNAPQRYAEICFPTVIV